MTIKILFPHWCASCRLMYDYWRVNTKANAKVSIGGTWPIGVSVPDQVTNTCPACEHKMMGQIYSHEDDASSMIFLDGVKEVG